MAVIPRHGLDQASYVHEGGPGSNMKSGIIPGWQPCHQTFRHDFGSIQNEIGMYLYSAMLLVPKQKLVEAVEHVAQ